MESENNYGYVFERIFTPAKNWIVRPNAIKNSDIPSAL